MQLKIQHRLLLLNILPREGSIITLRIVRDLQSALGFVEQELEEKHIVQEGDVFGWDDEANCPVDIPIGERAFDVIKQALVGANSQGKLRLEFIPLYEHFVEGKEWDALHN